MASESILAFLNFANPFAELFDNKFQSSFRIFFKINLILSMIKYQSKRTFGNFVPFGIGKFYFV